MPWGCARGGPPARAEKAVRRSPRCQRLDWEQVGPGGPWRLVFIGGSFRVGLSAGPLRAAAPRQALLYAKVQSPDKRTSTLAAAWLEQFADRCGDSCGRSSPRRVVFSSPGDALGWTMP